MYSRIFPPEQGSGSHQPCQQLLPLLSPGCNRLFFLIGANNNNAIRSLPAPFLLLSGDKNRHHWSSHSRFPSSLATRLRTRGRGR